MAVGAKVPAPSPVLGGGRASCIGAAHAARPFVLVVSPSRLVQHALGFLLRANGNFEILELDPDGGGADETITGKHAVALVVDLSGPWVDGQGTLSLIGRRPPGCRAVAIVDPKLDLSRRGELQAIVDAIVPSDVAADELIAAVKELTDERPSERFGSSDPPSHVTPREWEIICLIGEGRSNKEIARILDIRLATVRTHRQRLMAKLGLRNAVEIAIFAARWRRSSQLPSSKVDSREELLEYDLSSSQE